jgi:hypothetical protein
VATAAEARKDGDWLLITCGDRELLELLLFLLRLRLFVGRFVLGGKLDTPGPAWINSGTKPVEVRNNFYTIAMDRHARFKQIEYS